MSQPVGSPPSTLADRRAALLRAKAERLQRERDDTDHIYETPFALSPDRTVWHTCSTFGYGQCQCLYIYIYIYIYVCVCVCVHALSSNIIGSSIPVCVHAFLNNAIVSPIHLRRYAFTSKVIRSLLVMRGVQVLVNTRCPYCHRMSRAVPRTSVQCPFCQCSFVCEACTDGLAASASSPRMR